MSQTRPQMAVAWQIKNSLWIIFTLIPLGFTCYGAFFFIGIRANQKKWVTIGFIYLFLIMLSFILILPFENEHILTDIGATIILFAWLSSIFFSFAVRNQYLRIMFQKKVQYEQGLTSMGMNHVVDKKEIESIQQKTSEKVASSLEKDEASSKQTKQPLGKMKPAKKIVTTAPLQVININSVTEREIRALPSVHSFLAKKIVAVRKKSKPFRSIADMAEAVEVEPHIFKKATPYIAFTNEEVMEKQQALTEGSTNGKPKRRGRIVDY